jgi:hypothetical protein
MVYPTEKSSPKSYTNTIESQFFNQYQPAAESSEQIKYIRNAELERREKR